MSSFNTLYDHLIAREEKIVIVGLGYVGILIAMNLQNM